MKKIFTMAAIAATAFVSCTDNDNSCKVEPKGDAITIQSLISEVTPTPLAVPQTRTSYGGASGTTAAWAESDKIGLFCAESNPAAVNGDFTVTGVASTPVWTPTTDIYWKDGSTAHKFQAYYPYASGNSDPTAVKIPALNAQTGTLNSALDFLVSNNQNSTGVTRTASAVPLTFTHALTLVEFNIVLGAGVTSAITLQNVVFGSATVGNKLFTSDANSTINLSTAAITAGTATNTITLTPASAPTITAAVTPIRVFMLPGTFTAPTVQLNIKEGTTAVAIAASSIGTTIFAAATKYSYTITLSQSKITISAPTITDWTPITGTPLNPGIL